MKKAKKILRKICYYCKAKRNEDNLYFMNYKTGGQYACKNNDLCVLKMSYNKKIKKICPKL